MSNTAEATNGDTMIEDGFYDADLKEFDPEIAG